MERLKIMNGLIKKSGTSTPDGFAAKMGISKSTLMEYLRLMKEYGAKITYDKDRCTYCYEEEGRFDIGWNKINE